MTQTTIYRPDHDVRSIEDQDELNDLLRAGKLETKLVNNDPETLAAYAEAYWVHNLTDLIGFDKQAILDFEKQKKASVTAISPIQEGLVIAPAVVQPTVVADIKAEVQAVPTQEAKQDAKTKKAATAEAQAAESDPAVNPTGDEPKESQDQGAAQ